MTTDTQLVERLRVFNDVLRQLKDFTGPSLSMICGAFNDDTGKLIGSGTVVELRGKPYLVTAEHVASLLFARDAATGDRRYPAGLCHSTGAGRRLAWVLNPWRAVAAPWDVAVSRIEPDVLAGTGVVPLGADRFAPNTKSLDLDDIYFVHGWPAAKSRFTTLADCGILAESLPYGGWLADRTRWPGFDPTMHIVITYAATDLIDERGRPARFVMPPGMSGSLLWKTNRNRTGTGWSPADARVVGLVHRWDQDEQCLVATRIEYLGGFLLDALRTEFAYFRWHDRGRPQGDDWADWFAAEREVRRLTR